MVNAILAGKKNVTRRILKPPLRRLVDTNQGVDFHHPDGRQLESDSHSTQLDLKGFMQDGSIDLCPYGQVGATLWLKEPFYAYGRWERRPHQKSGREDWHFIDMTLESGHEYCFSQPEHYVKHARANSAPAWWLRPSLFMPRRASRVELVITDVRIERLRDITDEQARAEGFSPMYDGVHTYFVNHLPQPSSGMSLTAVIAFAVYWQKMHGVESWNENPWVWVLSFRRRDKSGESSSAPLDTEMN
jgi:hypothetical protein